MSGEGGREAHVAAGPDGRRRAPGRGARRVLPALLGAVFALACREEVPPAWETEGARLETRQPVAALEVYRRASTPPAGPGPELAAVRLLLRHQKVGWALERLRRLTERFPGEPALWRERYLAALANRLFDEAIESARQYVELAGPDGTVLRHLGILELHDNRPAEAVTTLQEAVELAEDPASWYALGRALEGADRPHEAVPVYRRAVERGAGPDAEWHLARLLARGEGAAEAREILERLAASRRLVGSGMYLLGQLRMAGGEREKGAALLSSYQHRARAERDERERGRRRQSLVEEVLILLRDGDPPGARALIETIRRDYGGDERLVALEAESWAAEGSLSRAAEGAEAAARVRPRSWRYRYLYALYLYRLGLLDRAVREVGTVIALQPLDLKARRLAVEIEKGRGAPPDVLKEAERAVETLRAYALPRELDDEVLPQGEPWIEFLFDIVQMHPLAGRAPEDAIPLD